MAKSNLMQELQGRWKSLKTAVLGHTATGMCLSEIFSVLSATHSALRQCATTYEITAEIN